MKGARSFIAWTTTVTVRVVGQILGVGPSEGDVQAFVGQELDRQLAQRQVAAVGAGLP